MDISTSEFLKTMRKTPLGSNTSLTMGEASLLANTGIDVNTGGEVANEIAQEKSSTNFWDNLFGTIDSLANAFGRGFVGMFEGIVDFGAGIIGSAVDAFGGDSSGIRDFIEVDMASNLANFTETFANFTPWGFIKENINFWSTGGFGGDYWNDACQAWSSLGLGQWGGVSDQEFAEWKDKYAFDNTWLEEESGWFGDLSTAFMEGAGQLVGMYLTGGLGAKAGLGVKATQALSLGTMSVGAAGKGTEEALSEGANLQQATLYGTLSGLTEAGTEMLGGIGGNFASGIVGKAALKNATFKKLTSTIGGKMVAGFLSEGLEEVMSDTVNPLWKKVSYDYSMDLGKEYTSGKFWANTAQSFIVGGLLGAVVTGGQYYKAGKATINGKKVGQAAAISYGEYQDVKSDYDKATKRANDYFAELVDKYGIDIKEGTAVNQAFDIVLNNENLTESEKAKFEKLTHKASVLNDKYYLAEEQVMKDLKEANISEEDLKTEYKAKAEEKAKATADEIGAQISTETDTENVGTHYDSNNNIVVSGENAEVETLSLNAMDKVDITAEMENIIANNETLQAEVQSMTDFYVAKEGISIEEATLKAKKTVEGRYIANLLKSNPAVLKSKKGMEEVANIANEGATGFEEKMNDLARSFEAPNLQKKIRVGKDAIRSSARWVENVSYETETIAVKLSNSAAAIENAFVKYGDSRRRAMLKTETIRMANSISAQTSLNGFYDNNTHEYKTKGLYNGKSGILDILESNLKQTSKDKAYIKGGIQTFYESLGLMLEQDRINANIGTDLVTLEEIGAMGKEAQAEHKAVFGRWLEVSKVPTDLLERISKELPYLGKAIENGISLDEASVNDLAHKGIDSANIKLNESQSEILKEVKKYVRQLNSQDVDNRLNEIDTQYPYFKELREEVYKYNRELLNMQYESGYITKEAYLWLVKNYSHYVPTYREMIMSKNADISVGVNSKIMKEATGSDLVIKDMFDSMQMQTRRVIQKCAINKVITNLVENSQNWSKANADSFNPYILENVDPSTIRSTDSGLNYYLTKPAMEGQVLTYYKNGEAHSVLTTNNVMEGFQSLAGVYKNSLMELAPIRWIAKAQGTVKSLLTTYNPFFSVRNAVRDFFDATFYSPTGMRSIAKNLPRSYMDVITNSARFQEFMANGGMGTSIFETSQETTDIRSKSRAKDVVALPFKGIARANEIVEISTRYAQYLATVDSLTKARARGENTLSDNQIVTEGVFEAHEITLNFNRAGTLGRQINNSFGMFFNANVQGFTKMVRTFISPRTSKEFVALLLKVLLLGIGTQLFNELLYIDDEDYQNINTSIKNNYYLIKVGDQFIRIPKGRVISMFNAFVTSAFQGAKGDNAGAQDSIKYALTEANNPLPGFSFGFFQGLYNFTTNTTWYGGQIVSSKWDATRPSEQYDGDTSAIGKWLGKVTNVSPLKWDYLLDQYTGIVGDILLPMTSDNFTAYGALTFIKDQFMIDPVTHSKYYTDYDNYLTELKYDKTDGDAIATIQVAYMNACNNEIKELRNKAKELEDGGVESIDKANEIRLINAMINMCYKEAVSNTKEMGEALRNYTITDTNQDEIKREVYREVLGAESALKFYSKNVYSKAQCYYKAGVSYDDFYVYYFNMRALPDKQAVTQYVNTLRVGANLKNLLYRLVGYSISEEKENLLRSWLKRKGLTDEEIDLLL